MRTIAHISDLHFGRIREEAEEALLHDLRAVRPSLIAVSGDLTQRALRKEFKRAREYLEKLPAPFIVVPGNHDIPFFDVTRRLLLPLHRYKNYISKQLNPLYVDNEIAVLGVNSARSLSLVNGKINRRQMRITEKVFSGLPDLSMRIVVTHHPFCKHPELKHREVIAGAGKTLQRFEDCGVDLILTGHYHRTYALDLRVAHPELKRSILHIQAGTAISSRTSTEPNSYNLLTLDGDQLMIDVRTWEKNTFRIAETMRFRRTKKGWQETR